MSDILLITKKEGLTKLQIAFNKLVKSIETKNQQLVLLETNIKKYNTKKNGALSDLQQQYVNTKLTYAKTLDNAFENNKFSKKDAEKLAQIIINICSLRDEYYVDTAENDELAAIIEKYQKYQTQHLSSQDQALAKDMMQMMMKEQFGFEVDLSDVENSDFDTMKERFNAAFEDSQTHRSNNSSGERKNKHLPDNNSEKAKLAADKLNKSWKSIYLNLVKKFHPDTEQDEAKKIEMDAVLKEVTTAYDSNNFYKLLELDIKYASKTSFESKDDSIVSEYVKILKKQEFEIKDKLYQLNNYIESYNLNFLKSKLIDGYINANLMRLTFDIKNEIERLQYETVEFSDINFLKKEIKKVKLEDLEPNFFDDFAF